MYTNLKFTSPNLSRWGLFVKLTNPIPMCERDFVNQLMSHQTTIRANVKWGVSETTSGGICCERPFYIFVLNPSFSITVGDLMELGILRLKRTLNYTIDGEANSTLKDFFYVMLSVVVKRYSNLIHMLFHNVILYYKKCTVLSTFECGGALVSKSARHLRNIIDGVVREKSSNVNLKVNKIQTVNYLLTSKGLTGLTAAVAVAVAGVCGCGWLRFLTVLRDLYDWFCG
ncbi:hypothetical protein YC2023_014552 [Brassica napus]